MAEAAENTANNYQHFSIGYSISSSCTYEYNFLSCFHSKNAVFKNNNYDAVLCVRVKNFSESNTSYHLCHKIDKNSEKGDTPFQYNDFYGVSTR